MCASCVSQFSVCSPCIDLTGEIWLPCCLSVKLKNIYRRYLVFNPFTARESNTHLPREYIAKSGGTL